MKINWVKCILALLVSALFGLLCFEITRDADSRRWICMTISWITTFICLASATIFDTPDKKTVNIKVNAWLFTILVISANIIFSCFVYNSIVYFTVVGLLVLLNVWTTYALYRRQLHDKTE